MLALVRDVAQVAAVRQSVGCHPNFAGFVLAGGEDVDVLHGGPGNDRLIEVFPTSSNVRLTQAVMEVDGGIEQVTGLEQAQLTGGIEYFKDTGNPTRRGPRRVRGRRGPKLKSKKSKTKRV